MGLGSCGSHGDVWLQRNSEHGPTGLYQSCDNCELSHAYFKRVTTVGVEKAWKGEGYNGWEKAFIHWDVSKAEIKTWYLLMESRIHVKVPQTRWVTPTLTRITVNIFIVPDDTEGSSVRRPSSNAALTASGSFL
jgi:hypothetical protein